MSTLASTLDASPNCCCRDSSLQSGHGLAGSTFGHQRGGSIMEEVDDSEDAASQPSSPKLDSISLPAPGLRPKTAPPAADASPAGPAAGRSSPFVRWAALQRAASDSMTAQGASMDPAAGGASESPVKAAASGSTGSSPAEAQTGSSPGPSTDGGSSAASSVQLSPTTQGLLMPQPASARSAATSAAAAGDTPTASLAAAFHAVATPASQRPPAPPRASTFPSAATPQGSGYSRQAYAEQPTVWSSPGTPSAAASPADTLPGSPSPAAGSVSQYELPAGLRHSDSDIWEAGRSLLPQPRRAATADAAGSSGGMQVAMPHAPLPRSLVPEAVAASGGTAYGGAGIAAIPEASPAPPTPLPNARSDRSPLRLSSLRAPSQEGIALPGGPAGRMDAARLSVMGRAIAATAASGQAPGSGGELLGGELHVRIVSGTNVLDALVHRQRQLTSESRRLKVGEAMFMHSITAVHQTHAVEHVVCSFASRLLMPP